MGNIKFPHSLFTTLSSPGIVERPEFLVEIEAVEKGDLGV
jgi:hypothetical protein